MRGGKEPNIDGLELFVDLYAHLDEPGCKISTAKAAVELAEREYLRECKDGDFDYSSSVNVPSGIDSKIMAYVYDYHLRVGSGASIYGQILDGCDGERLCAFCGRREAESLDHYKEKSKFPLLAITPTNLVPACVRCNSKLGVKGKKFHGYFDDLSGFEWLGCKLIQEDETQTPGLDFFVIPDFSSDTALVNRVSSTFEAIGLGRRWSTEFARLVSLIECGFDVKKSYQERIDFIDDQIACVWEEDNGPHATLLRTVRGSRWLQSCFGAEES